MKSSVLEVMKIAAEDHFKLGKAEFDGFDKIDTDPGELELSGDDLEEVADQLDVWAKIRIKYEGDPPENYRVMNKMIMDWVEDNESELSKLINPELIAYLKDQYEDVNVDDLDKDLDDYIWEDQVDYYPDVDEDKKEIKFIVELVLDLEDVVE